MERLDRLAISISLLATDAAWLENRHGVDWPSQVAAYVHEAIRRIEIAAKIARFEQKLTDERAKR